MCRYNALKIKFYKEISVFKLELLINEDKVDEVKKVLREIGIKKIALSEVKEYAEEYKHQEGYRGSTYIVDFIQKINVSILLNSEKRIERTLHMLSLANLEANVLVYEVMKSYSIEKRYSN